MEAEKLQPSHTKNCYIAAGCVLAAASFFEFSQGIKSALSTVSHKSEILKSSDYYSASPEARELAEAENAKAELQAIHKLEFKEFALSAAFFTSGLYCLSQAYFPKRDRIYKN